ncbi:CobW family GTP-binding protein [Methylobacterium planeticum]|uniref:GTP-binding protein n=1 Tax=Methylobacterium planeticum TaxID=2615211 RepID=A0A6N6MKF3_9HYPH|nr:GTP-binding protein [Methylobacterium planeticum]KAB1071658.1 GTP-binding protein [Methylobacterium planeticum]
MTERLPLFIITGFLGSGKTTLLQQLLRKPSTGTTGVVVNEFGEVGLDHRLLVHAKEHLELVEGGCICCARRQDIGEAIHDLVRRAQREGGNPLARAVIETTGLADPSPVVSALGRDPWMRAHVRLGRVICVLDAVNGLASIAAHGEALRQLAVADTVVVTKMDMGRAAEWGDLVSAVRSVTPDARILDAHAPDFDLEQVFAAEDGVTPLHGSGFRAEDTTHAANWTSFVMHRDGALDWPAFTLWLSALLHAHGSRIVRVKGLLRTTTSPAPLVIHGVQHVVHPPRHLRPEDDDGQPGYLVFITNGIGRREIEESLDRFLDRVRHPGARIIGTAAVVARERAKA